MGNSLNLFEKGGKTIEVLWQFEQFNQILKFEADPSLLSQVSLKALFDMLLVFITTKH
jgi:hypothetical protein